MRSFILKISPMFIATWLALVVEYGLAAGTEYAAIATAICVVFCVVVNCCCNALE